MPQTLIELGGPANGPLLHIAPANGFVPETYLPMLAQLTDSYRAICLPPRALWGDGPPPAFEPAHTWQTLADDLLAGLEQYDTGPVIGLGHSFGGVATMLAAIQQPQRFKAIILLDPTILPPPVIEMMAQSASSGLADQHPLVQATQRRRRNFADADDAFARFRQRTLFIQWPDDVLRLYAEHGSIPDPEGGVMLRWPPEWEAYYFQTGTLDTWAYLEKLRGLLPTLIVAGATSDTFIPGSAQAAAAMLPQASHRSVSGHGHLFPQSAPQFTGQLIRDWLGTQGL